MNSCATDNLTHKPVHTSLRVLVVDDDHDILGSIRDILELEDSDFIIETATSYDHALTLAKEFKPDIALLDIRIGTDNGIDLVQPLKAMYPDIICIMMTAYRDNEYTVSALRAGADDYMFKPLEPIKLFRTIRQFQLSQNLLRERVIADQRFRAIFNQSFQYLFILDQAGDIVDINNTALTNTGVDKDSIIGSQFSDAPWWKESTYNLLTIRNAVNSALKGESVRIEVELTNKDNKGLFFDFSLKPILDTKGNTIMIVPEGRDITDRKKHENNILFLNNTLEQRVEKRTAELELSRDEALKASLAKDTFMSHMSHELRTPMNAIIGFAHILKINKDEPLTELQDENVGHISTAGNHLLTLINQILDLTLMDSGKFKIDPSSIDICPVIDNAVKMIQPLADKKSISLVNDLSSNNELLAYADEHALSQVVINLISNAVKFSPVETSVRLSSLSSNQMLRFCVSDQGPGISDEDQLRIFQPFERIRTNAYVEGSGIGLTVCKNIMEMMDGQIGVESQPGEGSTFWIDIPLHKKTQD